MLGTPVNYDGTPVMDFHGFKVAADHGFQGSADHGFQGGADQVLQTCDPFSRHYSQVRDVCCQLIIYVRSQNLSIFHFFTQ